MLSIASQTRCKLHMPLAQDGVPAQIHRRVTLVRSSGSVGAGGKRELPSAQQPAAEPSGMVNGETPKRKKAKGEQEGTKELRLEDIVVKQVRAANIRHGQF